MGKFEVATTAQTYWEVLTRLKRGSPFAYTRYGDGEMEIMLGRGGGGQRPDEGLAAETRQLFENQDPANLIGLAMHQYEDGMRGLFESWPNPEYEQFRQPRRFENALMPHYVLTFKPGLMQALMREIRARNPIHVGSENSADLKSSLNWNAMVGIPSLDAYNHIDTTAMLVREAVRVSSGIPLVTLAAGPMKCALVRRLLEDKVPVQVIDLGSVVDLVLGVHSRTWIRKVLAENPDVAEAMMP